MSNNITNGYATTIFGDESIEAREVGLTAVSDFIDAVQDAFKECHDSILSNLLTDERDDIERDVMEWTGEIKRLNDLMHKAWATERRRLHLDKMAAMEADEDVKADHIRQERKDARLT